MRIYHKQTYTVEMLKKILKVKDSMEIWCKNWEGEVNKLR